MQGDKCMNMNDVMTMHKRETTNKSKKGIFLGRYNRHHQQGISPRDPRSCRGKSWLDYRIFFHRVDLVDTTNKKFLLDTTNKGFLLTLMMKNLQRTNLLG
jgi:hypothetical protein